MMYAQKGHAPVANEIQEAELRHNVRRLSHHPFIVLFDGTMQSSTSTSIISISSTNTFLKSSGVRVCCLC